jgi:hypothetical protein
MDGDRRQIRGRKEAGMRGRLVWGHDADRGRKGSKKQTGVRQEAFRRQIGGSQ